MGKRVLILGNGFDLAHDLPTRYANFLNFCDTICEIKNSTRQEGDYKFEYYNNVARKIYKRNFLTELMIKYYNTLIYKEKAVIINGNTICLNDPEYIIIDKFIGNIYYFVNGNIWYKYLYALFKGKNSKGENWIDFEAEISFIIETIDRYIKNITYSWHVVDGINPNDIDFPDKYKIFKNIVDNMLGKRNCTLKYIRKWLYNDLNDIINALEIYLSEFVEKYIDVKKLVLIDEIMPDYVINFNYTHTYQIVYNNYYSLNEIFYIHGELNHEPNNMVLGIDEYWSEEERDHHTNFTIFKKFAQRIQKRTGIESYKWFDEIKSDYKKNNEVAEVFIFGHSLDITDKDILYDYLESEATNVTIYCRDEETEGEYIANVIKIIGEKRLLEKVNQYPPKLKFVIQQPMVPIESEEEKELSTSGATP